MTLLTGTLLLLLAAAIYFLPTIIVFMRDHPQGIAVMLLNLLLGWTFLGWVVALVWSATHIDRRKTDQ